MRDNKRNFGLDLMRSIAIGGVLLGHFFNFLEPLAYFGVEFFFVLSGFLIGGILIKVIEKEGQLKLRDVFNFLKRRWFRTVPNYLLFLIVNWVCFKYFIKFDTEPNPLKFILFLQNLAWPRDPFFGESWSLCVEEWFYLTLPMVFFFARKALKNITSTKLFLYVSILFIIFPLVLRIFANPYQEESRLIVIYRLDSIMYGVILSYIKKYHSQIWDRIIALRAGSIFLCLALICFQFINFGHLGKAQTYFDSMTPLLFALTIPLFFDLGKPTQALLLNPVTKTSEWSYSLYLVHLPLLLSTKRYFVPMLDSPIKVLAYRLIVVTLSFIIAALIFKYYEKPMTNLRSRFSEAE